MERFKYTIKEIIVLVIKKVNRPKQFSTPEEAIIDAAVAFLKGEGSPDINVLNLPKKDNSENNPEKP